MKNEITITVSGPSGIGKSTIVHLIAALMNEAGIPYKAPSLEYSDVDMDARFDSLLVKGTSVRIVDTCTAREPTVRTDMVTRGPVEPAYSVRPGVTWKDSTWSFVDKSGDDYARAMKGLL